MRWCFLPVLFIVYSKELLTRLEYQGVLAAICHTILLQILALFFWLLLSPKMMLRNCQFASDYDLLFKKHNFFYSPYLAPHVFHFRL